MLKAFNFAVREQRKHFLFPAFGRLNNIFMKGFELGLKFEVFADGIRRRNDELYNLKALKFNFDTALKKIPADVRENEESWCQVTIWARTPYGRVDMLSPQGARLRIVKIVDQVRESIDHVLTLSDSKITRQSVTKKQFQDYMQKLLEARAMGN